MPVSSALTQLLDMGIPGGRAQAALKKAKGDAMNAAERVFAGEFDDIPSEDEGGDEDATPSPSMSTAFISTMPKRKSVEFDNDDDDEDDFLAEDDYFEDNEGEVRLLSDPYAGIFFSKDRVERVHEAVDEIRKVPLVTEKGHLKQIQLLSRSEWMSGCPEEGEQSHLFQLYSVLEDPTSCSSGCGYMFGQKAAIFFGLHPSFSDYTHQLKFAVRPSCPQCSAITCLACGDMIKTGKTAQKNTIFALDGPTTRLGQGQTEYDELLHCLPLQGVLLGVGLHMIEQAFAAPGKSAATIRATPPAKRRKKRVSAMYAAYKKMNGGIPTPGPDGDSDLAEDDDMYGIGRSTTAAKGVGYAGNLTEDRSGQIAAEAAQVKADKSTAEILSQVRVYLPTLNRHSGARSSDHLVHPTALANLRRRSGFVNDLLRNDSLLDMVNRRDLYQVLFDWLEVVSSHESLASMLAMPQMRATSSLIDPKDPTQKVVTYEGSASPRELLESCVIQAQAALKGLKSTKMSASDPEIEEEEAKRRLTVPEVKAKEKGKQASAADAESEQFKTFCEKILQSASNIDRSLIQTKGQGFVERMQASLPKLPDVGVEVAEKGAIGNADNDVVKIYEEWVTRARFQYCDMSTGCNPNESGTFHHAFNSQLCGLDTMDAPKRSLAIAKELAILTRNLPVAWHSSIFLRVDESRVDCIKAMIIGPEGTPYENGCFIFDIFLPVNYNQQCPQVKTMTTNGGQYRYNPNLYADGKVCLSLLGTWSGPGWIAGQSTLLQVLISIQSLILCEEPYLNEPGWAGDGGSSASKAYSANVRRMVMVDAMANNIKTPPKPFESEIKTHFRLKATYIRAQLEKWKILDDGRAIAGAGMGYYGGATGHTAGPSTTPFDSARDNLTVLLDKLEGKQPSVAPAKDKVKAKLAKVKKHFKPSSVTEANV